MSKKPESTEGGAAPAPQPPAAPGSLAALAQDVEHELEPEEAGQPGGNTVTEPEKPAALPNSQVVAQLVAAVRDTVCLVAGLESPKRTLTDEKVAKLGEIWGGVLDHYGITLADRMGKFGPVFAAAMATVPLLADTLIEARKEIAAKDAKAPAASPPGAITAAPPAPAGRGYTEGQVKPAFGS